MSLKKVKSAIQKCQEAAKNLQRSFELWKYEAKEDLKLVLLDACIKRFEVAFEYTWKCFKLASEYEGSEAPGPRPAILQALQFGWIENKEYWALALDARNGSVHDYFGISSEEYMDIVEKFLIKLPEVLKKLSQLK